MKNVSLTINEEIGKILGRSWFNEVKSVLHHAVAPNVRLNVSVAIQRGVEGCSILTAYWDLKNVKYE